MARTQLQSAPPTRQRDADLRRAEQEVGAQEAQLALELERLESVAGELLGRLQQAKAAASSVQLSGVRDPQFSDIQQRIGRTEIDRVDVSGDAAAALEARAQAIEVRQRTAERMGQAVQSWAAQLSRLSSQLTADESALGRFEAAQREQAARAQAQAEADALAMARAPTELVAPVGSPQPPPSSQVPTQAATRPQGRRVQARVRMQAAVNLHSDTNFFTGFSTNISEGGLFVATVQSAAIGTEIDLSFSLPSGESISVRGVVRWVREVNDKTPEIFPGVGIQFVDLDPTAASTLQRFVQSREPMFFPE